MYDVTVCRTEKQNEHEERAERAQQSTNDETFKRTGESSNLQSSVPEIRWLWLMKNNRLLKDRMELWVWRLRTDKANKL